MNGTLTARLLRSTLAFLLCATMVGADFAGSAGSISAQDAEAGQIPGFDPLPSEADLTAFASGEFDGEGIATLQVERIAVEPGAVLELIAGPFIVMVEQGTLAFEDDLGLDAEISAGDSQYFAPGEGDSVTNNGSETAIVLRTSLITDAPINGDPGPEDGGDEPDVADDEPVDLQVSAIDIAFEEFELTAPANNDFTITVTNNGIVKHGFVIEGTDFETSLIESGESETITVNLPAGEYTFFCPVPGHRQAGMQGTLIVSEDGGVTVEPDDSETDDTDNDRGPGEDTPITPRDGAAPTAGIARALVRQDTGAPDEVVISLTEAGFTPDTIDIARGGALVIENAGETSCEFTIADLDVAVELDAGDIEQITIDGPAGDYDLVCTASGDGVLGEGVLTIVDESAEVEPIEDATPEPAAEATPTPDVTEDPVVDDVAAAGPMGLLMQTSVTLGGASELFAATLTLQPGGVLPLISADGMLGMMVTGGDLTVVRPGRAAAVLRDGRTAILPSGTIAEMTNHGDASLTVLIAGVTGSSAAPDSEATNTPVSDDSGDDDASSDDTGSTDTGSASLDHYAFFPDDSELAELGLYPTWVAYTEISDPASNTFWLSGENSEASLTDWGWIRSSELRYSSEGEVTEYGEVSVMGILVDSFEDEDGAASFYAYIAEDTTGEPVDFLDGIDEVEDAIAFTFSGAASDTMIVAIHTGTYVITLFAAGPGIDAEALLDDVASLVFGVVG